MTLGEIEKGKGELYSVQIPAYTLFLLPKSGVCPSGKEGNGKDVIYIYLYLFIRKPRHKGGRHEIFPIIKLL